jgi:hypothetical protein
VKADFNTYADFVDRLNVTKDHYHDTINGWPLATATMNDTGIHADVAAHLDEIDAALDAIDALVGGRGVGETVRSRLSGEADARRRGAFRSMGMKDHFR